MSKAGVADSLMGPWCQVPIVYGILLVASWRGSGLTSSMVFVSTNDRYWPRVCENSYPKISSGEMPLLFIARKLESGAYRPNKSID